MTDEGNDPIIQRVVSELRRPRDLSPGVDRRVLAAVRGMRSPRVLQARRRFAAFTGVAAAAAAAAAGIVVSTQPAAGRGPRPVGFSIQAGPARSVAVVGDFNDWDPSVTPLTRTVNGEWRAEVRLAPGRYRYGFLVDGRRWLADPGRPVTLDQDFQRPTSMLAIGQVSP